MNKSYWIHWKPHNKINGIHNVSFIINSYETGFRLVLVNRQIKIRIEVMLVDGVDSYSYTDESFHYMRMSQVKKAQGESFFDDDWSFYEIINSPQIEQLKVLSGGTINDLPLRHFVILGADEFIDLIDVTEPTVSVFYD